MSGQFPSNKLYVASGSKSNHGLTGLTRSNAPLPEAMITETASLSFQYGGFVHKANYTDASSGVSKLWYSSCWISLRASVHMLLDCISACGTFPRLEFDQLVTLMWSVSMLARLRTVVVLCWWACCRPFHTWFRRRDLIG